MPISTDPGRRRTPHRPARDGESMNPLIPALCVALTVPALSSPEPRGSWPLEPEHKVVRYFDPPAVAWGRGHRGVDLVGRAGQPVRAALAGTVSFVGRVAGKPVVVIRHGETRTTYEPVRTNLAEGTHVAQGQRIGTLQSGPSHCAPQACLHWGLLRGKTYLNPLTLVIRRVRLLP